MATRTGSFGPDTLTGTSQDDALYGLEGDDTLSGGGGNDVLVGGRGDDVLLGGLGNDVYRVDGPFDGTDRFFDEGGFDVIDVQGGEISLTQFDASSGIDAFVTAGAGTLVVRGTQGGDLLDFSYGVTVQAGAMTILAAGGDDQVRGSWYSDTIVGGQGNDFLSGGEGGDLYVYDGLQDGVDLYRDGGSSGTDVLQVTTGDIQLGQFGPDSGIEFVVSQNSPDIRVHGTSGFDLLDFSRTAFGGARSVTISGGEGGDLVIGSSGAETVLGGSGADRFSGGQGDDTLIGGRGNDVLDGGDGSDTYRVEGGVDGLDTFQDSGSTGTDVVWLTDNRIVLSQFSAANGIEVVAGADVAGALNVSGTAGNDYVEFGFAGFQLAGGSSVAVDMGAGDDTFIGSARAESVIGGTGNDWLAGLGGDDVLNGGNGDDLMWGGDGNDTLLGGSGADAMHGNAGNDVLRSLAGNDTMWGDAGADVFRYVVNDGHDTVMDFNYLEGDKIHVQKAFQATAVMSSVGSQVELLLDGVGGVASITLENQTNFDFGRDVVWI